MRVHHGKHHARYVDVTNELLTEAVGANFSLEEIVVGAWRRGARKLFNNAAQALNHGLFWESMSPGWSAPSGDLAAALQAFDGGVRERFIAEGLGHFGSGWVWLASSEGALSIVTTHDGDSVARTAGLTPLLVCDLWEHAYYLDHKNDRAGYLSGWWDQLASWSFAQRQYDASLGRSLAWTYPTAAFAEGQTASA